MQEEKILITGSQGLIGHALKNQLRNIGVAVQGMDIDCLSTHSEHGNIENLQLIKALATECKGIVHLAAVARVIAGEQNPQRCWNINVEGTRNVLQAANDLPHKPWVLYGSSREVYGQQATLPVNEKAPLLPLNVYARSKVAAEKLVSEYREKGLQTATIRFSNVYGSTDDYADRVIPAFCRAAAWGGTIRIDGSHNIFDFTYIDDVVAGIVKVVDKLQAGCMDLPSMHFTSGQGITLRQAAELARSFSRHPVELLEAPSRSFDVARFYGDSSLAEQLLGWKVEVTLQEGMAQFINQFKNQAEPKVVNRH